MTLPDPPQGTPGIVYIKKKLSFGKLHLTYRHPMFSLIYLQKMCAFRKFKFSQIIPGLSLRAARVLNIKNCILWKTYVFQQEPYVFLRGNRGFLYWEIWFAFGTLQFSHRKSRDFLMKTWVFCIRKLIAGLESWHFPTEIPDFSSRKINDWHTENSVFLKKTELLKIRSNILHDDHCSFPYYNT